MKKPRVFQKKLGDDAGRIVVAQVAGQRNRRTLGGQARVKRDLPVMVKPPLRRAGGAERAVGIALEKNAPQRKRLVRGRQASTGAP